MVSFCLHFVQMQAWVIQVRTTVMLLLYLAHLFLSVDLGILNACFRQDVVLRINCGNAKVLSQRFLHNLIVSKISLFHLLHAILRKFECTRNLVLPAELTIETVLLRRGIHH